MVKIIILANNKGVALVNDKDYEELSKYYYYLDDIGYARNGLKNKRMHQFILNTPEGYEIDHIDHNKLNNQRSNLRIVTRSQNMMNSKKRKDGSSIYKGVSWVKRDKKWQAYINKDGNRCNLGSFKNEIDAAKAYNERAVELFGEYARLNEID